MPHYDKAKGKDGGIVVWEDSKRVPNKLPTLRDFAKSISVGVSTIYDWLNGEHSSFQREFSDAFTYAQDIRKWFLIQNGLQGLYNPLFAKFTAINITDMRDQQEHEHGISKELATLLGLIDGSSKGSLPDRAEEENAE